MKLKTLKSSINTLPNRVKVLDTKAGATQMERGGSWMAKRERVAMRHGYRCAACDRVLMPGQWECDHIIPREQGGSNDESNLQPLCQVPCHQNKTAQEAKARNRRVENI